MAKRKVHTNSLIIYRDILESLPERRKSVLEALIKLGKATDKQIAKFLKWPQHHISPRRGELQKSNLIKEAGIFYNKQNRPESLWELAKLK